MSRLRKPLPVSGLAASLAVLSLQVHAAEIELVDGDTINGEIVETTDDAVIVEHPTLGKLTIAKDQIVPADKTKTPETDAEKAAAELGNWVDSWFFPGWDKSFAAGFTGTDGNSDTLNIYAALNTGYEDDFDRWALDMSYFRGETDGETTQAQFKGILTKDWLKPDTPVFYWAQGSYQFDRFTDWESRFAGFVGIGYVFIDGDVHTVRGRAGVGGKYELGDVNEFTPEAMGGIEWDWAISETQTFAFYNYFYPSLDPAFSEFRNLTGAAYEVELAAGKGLKLRLGLENEYNSDPGAGFDENDLKYFGALAFDF